MPDAWDTDGDGVPDEFDTDGDGIPDSKDKDGDGKPDNDGNPLGVGPEGENGGPGLGGGGPGTGGLPPGIGVIPGTDPANTDDPDNPNGGGSAAGGITNPVKEPGEGIAEVLDSNPTAEDFYKTYQSYAKNKVTVTSEFNGLRIKGVAKGDFIVLKEVKLIGSNYEFSQPN